LPARFRAGVLCCGTNVHSHKSPVHRKFWTSRARVRDLSRPLEIEFEMLRCREKLLRKCWKGLGTRNVKSTPKSREVVTSQSGFTLAELVVVVAIILVVGGLSIPNLTRAIDTSQLKGASQTLASVYQDARIRATQNDTSYAVLVSPGITPAQICIDLDGDGACGAGDSVTTFPGRVSVSNLGVPVKLGPAQLTYLAKDTEYSTAPGTVLVWNAVGLPCQRSPGGAQCTAPGWVQYLQLQSSNGNVMYAAVTASPTGRVKTWIFIPGSNGNGQWL
jgi:prepilin-type N-terminal cleavage/methylation domain-containing protein